MVALRIWIGTLLVALTLGAAPSYALSPKPEFRNVRQIVIQCFVPRAPGVLVVLDANTLCAATVQALQDGMAPQWADAIKAVRIGAEETRGPMTFTISVRGIVMPGSDGSALIGLSFSIYRQGLSVRGAHLPPAPFVAFRPAGAEPLSEQTLRDMMRDFMDRVFAVPIQQANPRHP